MLYTRKELEEKIRESIATNSKAAKKALLILYSYQTAEEKAGHYDLFENGVGFTHYDAEFLTSLAFKVDHGQTLTLKQEAALMKCVSKYSKQIFDHSVRHGTYIRDGRKWLLASKSQQKDLTIQ